MLYLLIVVFLISYFMFHFLLSYIHFFTHYRRKLRCKEVFPVIYILRLSEFRNCCFMEWCNLSACLPVCHLWPVSAVFYDSSKACIDYTQILYVGMFWPYLLTLFLYSKFRCRLIKIRRYKKLLFSKN